MLAGVGEHDDPVEAVARLDARLITAPADRHSHCRSSVPVGPRDLALIALIARWHRKGDPVNLEHKCDQARPLLLCGVIRRAGQLERSRNGTAVEIDDRESCVILRPVSDRVRRHALQGACGIGAGSAAP